MADLLKRTPKKSECKQTVTPRTIVSTVNLLEPTKEDVVEKNVSKTNSPLTKKNTTVRVSFAVKNKLNALVIMGVADSVDRLIDILIDEYVNNILSENKEKQLELLLDIYKNKKNKM